MLRHINSCRRSLKLKQDITIATLYQVGSPPVCLGLYTGMYRIAHSGCGRAATEPSYALPSPRPLFFLFLVRRNAIGPRNFYSRPQALRKLSRRLQPQQNKSLDTIGKIAARD